MEQVLLFLNRFFLGFMIFSSGRLYLGKFREDEKDKGTEVYPNSERYEGSFLNGKKHGRGSYLWPNGESYDGEW